jgi:ribose-phosphate pyrophosphokinase
VTAPLVAALPGNESLAARLAEGLGGDLARTEFRRFPDEESYVRFDSELKGRSLVLVCTLDRPDAKFLPLAFAAGVARELGAVRVGLVAPYLAYMRQDRRFQPGEAVTAPMFAQLLSRTFDWLVTVDPHLHRVHGLKDIYAIPATALHAAPLLSEWIAREVKAPLLVGPDEESAQWVGAVAREAGALHVVLSKIRKGDREVEVSVPEVERWRGHTPVLVDDIISSARTMIETLTHLNRADMKPAVCVGVHAVFASGAYAALEAAGPARIVTTDSIPHPSNIIPIAPLLLKHLRDARPWEIG